MATAKHKNPVSGARCFRKDLPRIKRLAAKLGADETSTLFQEHVISRALAALEEKVLPQNEEGAPAGTGPLRLTATP